MGSLKSLLFPVTSSLMWVLDYTSLPSVLLSIFQQEPSGDPVEIANAIRWTRPGNDFSLQFPIFKRDQVNGEGRNPLYQFALVNNNS